jgi:hypothetical protein
MGLAQLVWKKALAPPFFRLFFLRGFCTRVLRTGLVAEETLIVSFGGASLATMDKFVHRGKY